MTNTFHPILPSSPGLGQRHAHRRRLHRHPRIQQRQKRRVPRAGRHGAVTAAELNDDLGSKDAKTIGKPWENHRKTIGKP